MEVIRKWGRLDLIPFSLVWQPSSSVLLSSWGLSLTSALTILPLPLCAFIERCERRTILMQYVLISLVLTPACCIEMESLRIGYILDITGFTGSFSLKDGNQRVCLQYNWTNKLRNILQFVKTTYIFFQIKALMLLQPSHKKGYWNRGGLSVLMIMQQVILTQAEIRVCLCGLFVMDLNIGDGLWVIQTEWCYYTIH